MSAPNYAPTIFKLATTSRILILTLIILWRSLVTPYDTSASINPNCLSPPKSTATTVAKTVLFPSVGSSIEDSIVWDSVYFVRIAQCGYEYEQSYAFLPLLPILISFLTNTVFWPLVPLVGYRAVLGLSGYAISNVAFALAAVYFYRLSVLTLKDPEASFRASILFCFNPASIFYSSMYSPLLYHELKFCTSCKLNFLFQTRCSFVIIYLTICSYTESLYALFSLGGLYYLAVGANYFSVPWLALSGSARSNGVLNAGYFCFQAIHDSYNAIVVRKHAFLVLQVLISVALQCILIFAPFIAFQVYGFYNICHGRPTDERRPWCKTKIPLLYNFIQNHYWGVGFLRHFQVKQLPNFLLACPILSLAVCSIYSYVKVEPNTFFSLGLGTESKYKRTTYMLFPHQKETVRDNSSSTMGQVEHENLKRRRKIKAKDASALLEEFTTSERSGYYSVAVLPFLLHLGFMAATAFFVMHVQVATRFLSSSPVLYWFASQLMASPGLTRKSAYFIWVYSVAYILLGSLLFSNFYPFT